jgi:CRP-like cAMP-binding protein
MATCSRTRIAQELTKIDIFQGLTNAQLHSAAALFKEEIVSHHRVILARGEDSGKIYCVCKGLLKICVPKHSLALAGPGETVGEINFSTGAGHTADVVALESCRLFVAQSHNLRTLADEIPLLAGNITRLVARRFDAATDHALVVSTKSIAGRLAACLLLFADKAGERRPDGSIIINVSIDQKEFANFVPTHRSNASRILNEFADRKLIEFADDRYVIVNRAGLENQK